MREAPWVATPTQKACVYYIVLLLFAATSAIEASARLVGKPRIDSLLGELQKKKDDTNKVKLLDLVSGAYTFVDPNEGVKYGQMGLELATRLRWNIGMAKTNNAIAANYQNLSDPQQALTHYNAALQLFEKIGNKSGVAMVTGNIGNAYFVLGDFPKTLEYYFKAIELHTVINDKAGLARVTGNIGIVYQEQGDYPHALEYLFKALKMRQEVGNMVEVASTLGNIGNDYLMQGDLDHAMEYYLKALKLHESLGNKTGIAAVTGSIGTVYERKGDNVRALDHLFKALKMHEERGEQAGVAEVAAEIGEVRRSQRNYAQALAWHFKAMRVFADIGNKNGEAAALVAISDDQLRIAIDNGNGNTAATDGQDRMIEIPANLISGDRTAVLRRAAEYAEKAIPMQKESGDLDGLYSNYKLLSVIDSLLGDYRGAYSAHVAATFYKDSMFSKDNLIRIARLESRNRAEADSLKNVQEKRVAVLRYRQQRNYSYLGLAGVLGLLIFSGFILRERKRSDLARKRSDDLLLNILPGEVADELKVTGSSAARSFENVTVLFTDFVNFTEAGERMSPQDLLDELHACFSAFDEITTRYNIEKIKTIGDAYLAAAGIPAPDPKHAENVIRAALEISAFMSTRYARLGDRTFRLRIGIHSGGVIAGIVGVRKFAYDIWGDTVNTAARMEQNCEPGKVNISAATHELVKDRFVMDYRGEVEVKNKGAMKMYYVRDMK